MSLGDRFRRALDRGGSDQPRRRQQAQPVGGYEPEGRPLQRAQWIGLGIAAAAAVALTAGLVFAILTITRPGEPRPSATPTAAVAVVSPVAQDVSTLFTTSTPTPAPTLTPLPRIDRQQVANTQGEGVNLRREPGQTGELVKIIPEGTLVDVIGQPQDIGGTRWVNVRDSLGDTGWIASSFLVAEGTAPPTSVAVATSVVASTPGAGSTPAATTAPVAKPQAGRGQVGNTGGQGANIRSEPGPNGRVLKTLAEGTTVEVLGTEREVDGQVWRQVRDSAGVTGWIVRGAVVPPGTLPTPAPPGTRVATTPAPAGTPGGSQGGTPAQAAATAAPSAGQTPAPAQQATPVGATNTPSGNLPVIIAPQNTPTPRPGGSPAPR